MSQQFRFAALLQWRERQRDEAGAAVGLAVQAINHVDEQRLELMNQLAEVKSSPELNRVGDLSINRLLADGRYSMQLEIEIRTLDDTRRQLVEALHARQEKLVLAEAEVKRFERLKEIDREAEEKEYQRREQLSIDETVTNRYLMQMRKPTTLRETTS